MRINLDVICFKDAFYIYMELFKTSHNKKKGKEKTAQLLWEILLFNIFGIGN